MKRLFFALAVLASVFTACDPEEAPFAASFDTSTFSESGSATATKTMTSVLSNTSSTSGTVSWSFSETNAVAGWTYTISIDGTTQSGTSGSFDLAGNASSTIMVTVNPNGTGGTGTAMIEFTANSAAVGTLSYSYTASSTPPAPNFSLSSMADTGTTSSGSPMREYKTVLTNLTGSDLTIKWVRVEASSYPNGWSSYTCDYIQCHTPNVVEFENTLPANYALDFKTTVNSAGIDGTGDVTTYIFEPSDSAGTVQIYTINNQHQN